MNKFQLWIESFRTNLSFPYLYAKTMVAPKPRKLKKYFKTNTDMKIYFEILVRSMNKLDPSANSFFIDTTFLFSLTATFKGAGRACVRLKKNISDFL